MLLLCNINLVPLQDDLSGCWLSAESCAVYNMDRPRISLLLQLEDVSHPPRALSRQTSHKAGKMFFPAKMDLYSCLVREIRSFKHSHCRHLFP